MYIFAGTAALENSMTIRQDVKSRAFSCFLVLLTQALRAFLISRGKGRELQGAAWALER